MYDNTKLSGLFKRVLNSQSTTETDVADITQYIQKVFGNGSVTPDPSMLHQFNNLIVAEADKIAKPKVTNVLNLLATNVSRNRGDLYAYNIPKQSKAKFVWAAKGTSVDLIRVEGQEKRIATPDNFQTGFSYEILALVQDPAEGFRKLVDDLANAKVRLYMEKVSEVLQKAISTSKIPPANVKTGNNLTLADFNKVSSVLQRYGGRPVFIGDTLLIDYFAQQQATGTHKDLLTDDLREELRTALNPTSIGRTTAINLVNPFVDATNTKTELPVNEGYMLTGSVSQKPFIVVEYGGMRQQTETDIDIDRVKMKITQEAAVELVFGEAIGYIREDAAVQ
jgi:hypothetical protein